MQLSCLFFNLFRVHFRLVWMGPLWCVHTVYVSVRYAWNFSVHNESIEIFNKERLTRQKIMCKQHYRDWTSGVSWEDRILIFHNKEWDLCNSGSGVGRRGARGLEGHVLHGPVEISHKNRFHVSCTPPPLAGYFIRYWYVTVNAWRLYHNRIFFYESKFPRSFDLVWF